MFIMINAIFTLVIGFVLLSFTARGEKFLRTEKAIDDKADIEYVDKQDDLIRTDLNTFRVEVDNDMDRMIDNMNKRFDEQSNTLDKVIYLLKE